MSASDRLRCAYRIRALNNHYRTKRRTAVRRTIVLAQPLNHPGTEILKIHRMLQNLVQIAGIDAATFGRADTKGQSPLFMPPTVRWALTLLPPVNSFTQAGSMKMCSRSPSSALRRKQM